jgi:hypothetical protein
MQVWLYCLYVGSLPTLFAHIYLSNLSVTNLHDPFDTMAHSINV